MHHHAMKVWKSGRKAGMCNRFYRALLAVCLGPRAHERAAGKAAGRKTQGTGRKTQGTGVSREHTRPRPAGRAGAGGTRALPAAPAWQGTAQTFYFSHLSPSFLLIFLSYFIFFNVSFLLHRC